MQSIAAAFEAARQKALDSSDVSDTDLLPLKFVPEALEALGLDAHDEEVLSIFRECAEPIGQQSARKARSESTTAGVALDQFKEVCEVLLVEAKAHQADNDDEHDEYGSTSSADLSDPEFVAASEADSIEDASDEDFTEQAPLGQKSNSAGNKAMRDAAYVIERLRAAAGGLSEGGTTALTARDLVAASRKIGEELSESDAKEMIEIAHRLSAAAQSDTVLQKDVAAVLARTKQKVTR